jgi:hypothetical protein
MRHRVRIAHNPSVSYNELRGEWMALATSDLRFMHRATDLAAVSHNAHSPLQARDNRPPYLCPKPEEFAGIGAQDARHRAGLAQVATPALAGLLQQPTLLRAPTTEVVAVKIPALNA